MRVRASVRQSAQQGYSLIELVVVVAMIAVITAISVLVMPTALTAARSAGAASQVESALRTAREQALSQRRAIRITFTPPRTVDVVRVELDGALVPLGSTTLEGGFQFLLFPGQPDTPDGFGRGGAIELNGATTVQFTSEGTFVDENGDEANASVFLGRAQEPQSAAAVTVFGPTALIRNWRWDGSAWVR